MKDIKFRAFHKPTSKKMFDVVQIDFTNKIVFSYERIHNTSKYSYFDTVSYNFSDCELMQYTGLTDCEGKDIFEGDIVKVFESQFKKENNAFKIAEISYSPPSFFLKSNKLINQLSNAYEIKILGNIHQNSELLEKNK